jgi:hypothetical protein
MYELTDSPALLDIIVDVKWQNGTAEVVAQLDVRNNAQVEIGDLYLAPLDDGSRVILSVFGFESAASYTHTIERVADAMRQGVTGPPQTMTAKWAYQIKMAKMRVVGELLIDGGRRLGCQRVPDPMVPLQAIDDDAMELYATDPDGNLIMGNLRSGARATGRVARIDHNFGGDRLLDVGQPGMGKSTLARAVLSQQMALPFGGTDE